MIKIDLLTYDKDIIVSLKPTPNGKDVIGYNVHNKPIVMISYEDYLKLKVDKNEEV